MDYPGAVALLERLGNEVSTAKFGLENIESLCSALRSPERRFPSILIAGTNGKGSTATFLYSILIEAQLPVGCFTSPHLVHLRERIRVGRSWISKTDFANVISDVESVAGKLLSRGSLAAHPTYFEILTAAAFHHFARLGVRLAILEVGLGGRLDATNVCNPLLTVITSISLDHQKYLGSRLEEIAFEKAGILRSHIPLLLGPMDSGAADTILKQANDLSAPVCSLPERARISIRRVVDGFYQFDLRTPRRTYRNLKPALRGPHQPANSCLSILAAEMLQGEGYPISEKHIHDGIRSACWPGRLQVVRENPRLILDGAHNPEAVKNLKHYLTECFRGGDLLLVFGAMQDKDFVRLAEQLFPLCRAVLLTQSRNERALGAETLFQSLQGRFQTRLHVTVDVASAIRNALELANPDSWILLTGSLYLVGEAMEYLGIDPTEEVP